MPGSDVGLGRRRGAGSPHPRPSAPLRGPALLGTAGAVLLALGVTRAGALAPGSDRWPLTPDLLPLLPGAGPLLPVAATYAGLVLLCRAWLALVRTVRAHHAPPVAAVAAIAVVWCLPLLLAAPVGSRDAYAYVAYGSVLLQGDDPAVVPPADLPAGAVRDAVDPIWMDAPSPYGPVSNVLIALAAYLGGGNPVAAVLAVKLLALVSVALLAAATARLATRWRTWHPGGPHPALAVALVVANPLVVVHLVSAGHNEAWMLPPMVAGVAAVLGGRRALGVVLLTVAVLAKAPAALVLVWALVPSPFTPRDVLRSLRLAALAAAVAAAAHLVTGTGPAWVGNLTGNAGTLSWLSLSTVVGLGVGGVLALAGFGGQQAALTVAQAAGTLTTAVAAAAALLLAVRHHVAALVAVGLAITTAAVLGAAVHPWYLAWGLPLVVLGAPEAGPRLQRIAAGVCVVATFAAHPGGTEFFLSLRTVPAPWVGAAVVALAALALWRSGVTRAAVVRLRGSTLPKVT